MSAMQTNTLFVAPPALQNIINVDVAISARSLQVSITVEGSELTTVSASDLIPRNIFTEYLSRSILSVVAAYGPWSSGYGLPPLQLQVTPPRTFLQVATNDVNHVLCFTTGIHNPATSSLVQMSEITPDQAVSVMPTVLPASSSKANQMTPDSDLDVDSTSACILADDPDASEAASICRHQWI